MLACGKLALAVPKPRSRKSRNTLVPRLTGHQLRFFDLDFRTGLVARRPVAILRCPGVATIIRTRSVNEISSTATADLR